jgi:hypothetical protein
MMYQIPDLKRKSFARTNFQTIFQRIALLRELVPSANTIAEICCGDCSRQFHAYSKHLNVRVFRCLDIEPAIVAENKRKGIECYCGDALDKATLQRFASDDVIFFGPPLSIECDGHHMLRFDEVVPGYKNFARLLLSELKYSGVFICICPNTTTMGDVAKIHHQIRSYREDFNLPVIHHSYSTITGYDEPTEMRLRYIELWFSDKHGDSWDLRESKPSRNVGE